ncbi:MAG: hypothetical protein DI568_10215 [Sphingomonas sp.]|nr:MAG: hypothetical protein DI568_10215 [Sphingomonas sp.]
MSQFISPSELNGLTEHQLRAKRVAILNDLAARGKRIEDCPHVQISIRFIDEALARVVCFRPKPPGF